MNDGKRSSSAELLAKGLGWFSIGLGLAEILAPRAMSRLVGVKPRPDLLRGLGAREVVNGVAILMLPQKPAWMMARVAGDAMDLGLLGSAWGKRRVDHHRLGAAMAAVAGVTALDVVCAWQLSKQKPAASMIHLTRVLTVNRPRDEVYQFWRRFDQFPRFMNHLVSVQETGGNRSHWVAKGPAGSRVEWDAEMIADEPGQRIAWRSLPGSQIENAGQVQFERAAGDRGTIVRIELHYRPPAGALGARIATLLAQSPEKQITMELLRFKQLIETGEISRTEGQSAGRARSVSRKYDELLRK